MRTVTLILSGAITQGAFEAGVLRILAERQLKVRRIAASSSGALNGTAFAAGVRARREEAAAEELVAIWRDQASWRDVLHFSLRGVLRRQGISDQKNLLALLRRNIQPARIPDPAPIDLCIILAAVKGAMGFIGHHPATTFTRVMSFNGPYFDGRDLLEEVFTAAVASAAFPYIFVPVDVPGVGPCIDGALVDSTPIRSSIDWDVDVDAIVVIAPTPTYMHPRQIDFRGARIFGHVVNMIFNERLYSDVRDVVANEAALLALEELGRRIGFGPDELAAVKTAFGWQHRRVVPIIAIRPLTPLPGGLFSGFVDPALRRRYIELGMERATQVFDALGWR